MADDVLVAFGRRIRELRLARGWTQEELAERTGFHRNYIGMAERGERNVSLRNLAVMSKAFGIKISRLLDNMD